MQGERSGQKSKAQDSTKARAETTDDLEPEVAKNQQPKQPLEEVFEPKAKKQKKKNIAVKKERLDKVAQPAEKKQKMQQLDTEMAGGDAEPDTEPVLLRKREKGRASFADAPAGDEIEKAEATTQETKAYKSSERKRILSRAYHKARNDAEKRGLDPEVAKEEAKKASAKACAEYDAQQGAE